MSLSAYVHCDRCGDGYTVLDHEGALGVADLTLACNNARWSGWVQVEHDGRLVDLCHRCGVYFKAVGDLRYFEGPPLILSPDSIARLFAP